MNIDDLYLLKNKNEIIDLTYKYAWAIDDHNWDLMNDVFIPDATAMLVGQYFEGRESIKNFIEKNQSRLISQHFVSNHLITINEDTAYCKCQLQAQHFKKGFHGSSNYLLIGMYIDKCIKTTDGWRISHRELIQTWSTGAVDLVVPSIPIPDALMRTR
jgi:3-phenylpropionate/cinnamic acid dioxygenase small subunit